MEIKKVPVYELHSTEAEVKAALPSMANLMVDGMLTVPDLTNLIVSWIQNRKT